MEPTQQPLAFDTQGNLIIPGVHSDNYAAGVSGWTINSDGSAEFNNVIIRNGQVVSGTELFYSGTPALGNLTGSISATAGTDTFGNQYLEGFTSYDRTRNDYMSMRAGGIFVGRLVSGQPTLTNALQFGINTGSATTPYSVWTSPASSTNTKQVAVALLPGSGSTQSLAATIVFGTLNTVDNVYATIFGGSFYASDIVGNILGWQSPAYTANWSGGTTFNTLTGYNILRFRKDVEDNVCLVGALKAGAVLPGTTVFTLPTGYRPVGGTVPIPCLANNAGTLSHGMLSVLTNGNVVVQAQSGLPLAVNAEYLINGNFSLGNLS